MEQEEKVVAYKGFNNDLTCMGFQYEVGKEYEEKEEIKVCTNGFHACENPFNVLDFYGDIHNSRFCKVEQAGTIKKSKNKQASSKIKVLKEIGLAGLFEAGIDWINKITNPATIIKESKRTNDENKIGSIESFVQIASSENCVKIGSSGDRVQIASSGDGSEIGSNGDCAQIASSGDSTCIGSSGYYAKMASSGDFVKMASSGTRAKISSSGSSANIGSNSNFAYISSSGDNAYIGSIGGCAQIASSGDIVKIVSSGESAKIGSSGDFAKIESIGEDSIVCCAGINSVVKAKKGSWITLSEWQYSQEKKRHVPICVKTEYVDGERIKEDVWYRLKDGKFVEYSPKEE